MADTMNRYFNPFRPVKSEELLFGNGVTSVNDMLGFTLLDEGGGILLGMPVYGSFDWDFKAKAQ
jgi:1-aminocyclopropane-1-carboxylate synthase